MTRSAPFDLQIACCGVSLARGTAAGTPQARAPPSRPTPAPTHPLLLRGSSLPPQLPAPLDLHPYRDAVTVTVAPTLTLARTRTRTLARTRTRTLARTHNPNPYPNPNPNPS